MWLDQGRKKPAVCGPERRRRAALTASAERLLSSPPTSAAALTGIPTGVCEIPSAQPQTLAISQPLDDFGWGIRAFGIAACLVGTAGLASRVLGRGTAGGLLSRRFLIGGENPWQNDLARILST
jgi:hypothetical protein